MWGPHVSDSEANPALTRALTRYGAHCQCHGVSLTRSLVLIRRATSAVAGVSPATTTADSGGAPCARYGAPFDVRFAPTGSWEKGASKEASDSSWGGRSCRRRALLRLPEFGHRRELCHRAREEQQLGDLSSFGCAERVGGLISKRRRLWPRQAPWPAARDSRARWWG